MPDDAVEMQAIVETAHWQSSYLGRVLGKAWARVTSAGPRAHPDQVPDGLEAFDMLGGWKGSGASRCKIG
ncbi:hypothetical protein [Aminobacter sp. AP02]|uniref:hypothetical protein n=1 Tax=Aminobacter sp. AP02 TaxID=2135737 RepID=UPI000D7B886E|nr:hypothetical protein [Aminobacter sp. AP02]PWK70628.1 hypothetical protein C8K44_107107 [Aminobacter sp. AP02]